MNLQLDGQLALVTASTKGIGHAIARALAAEGARVIVNGRTAAGVDEAVQRILGVLPKARLEKFPGDLSQAAVLTGWWPHFPRSTSSSTTSASSIPNLFARSRTRNGSASSTSTC